MLGRALDSLGLPSSRGLRAELDTQARAATPPDGRAGIFEYREQSRERVGKKLNRHGVSPKPESQNRPKDDPLEVHHNHGLRRACRPGHTRHPPEVEHLDQRSRRRRGPPDATSGHPDGSSGFAAETRDMNIYQVPADAAFGDVLNPGRDQP